MGKRLKWIYFLSKRLYKKWMFILLIALIPLSVGALTLTSTQGKGFVHIAVVNGAGDLGEQILENLDSGKGIIHFAEYDEIDAARIDLAADRLDAIWVLPEHMEERIAEYVHKPTEDHAIVQVIRKEESLKTRLSLEKLSSAMYPFLSRQLFLERMRTDPDFDLSHLSDAEITRYFDDFFSKGELFEFSFPDNAGAAKDTERDYMTSPVRGLLSVVTLLAGLSSAMLFISDEKKGVFAYAKNEGRVFLSLMFQLTAVLNIGFFAFVSVFLLGVNTYVWRECLIFLIFALNTALFCTILQQLIPRLVYFAPIMVLTTVLDVMICPIFFDYTVQRIPQYLLPNAYYINSVHSNDYLLSSLLFMAS
ncbi:MAG: hypothetical protein IKI63_00485 [Clostridia bacterium]|nr:hypothetical protein [Clostridia bacterium]